MEPVSILKEQVEGAHGILEQTMADVTPEQAHWSPPGVAKSARCNVRAPGFERGYVRKRHAQGRRTDYGFNLRG